MMVVMMMMRVMVVRMLMGMMMMLVLLLLLLCAVVCMMVARVLAARLVRVAVVVMMMMVVVMLVTGLRSGSARCLLAICPLLLLLRFLFFPSLFVLFLLFALVRFLYLLGRAHLLGRIVPGTHCSLRFGRIRRIILLIRRRRLRQMQGRARLN